MGSKLKLKLEDAEEGNMEKRSKHGVEKCAMNDYIETKTTSPDIQGHQEE